MDFPNESIQILEQFDSPAFFADSTQVLTANSKAQAIGIYQGAELSDLFENKILQIDAQLSFTQMIRGIEYTVSASPISEVALFKLTVNDMTQQLQALMHAAQQLRVPLSGLTSSINLLKQEQDSALYSKTTKHLLALQRAVRNMSDAALFLEDRSSKKEILDMGAYFTEIAQKLQQHFSDSNIAISYSAFDEKLYCNVDILLLERAIYNMVSNSLKAGSTQLQLDLKKAGQSLHLTVTDNGCGMTDEQKANMLTHFREQPNWLSQSYGLGLGMMIIHAAAKAHNGTVLIGDAQPHGCKITLTIAIEKGDLILRQKTMGIHVDPLGGIDPLLLELSDVLPAKDYL